MAAPVRLLGLHGRYQNATRFAERISGLRLPKRDGGGGESDSEMTVGQLDGDRNPGGGPGVRMRASPQDSTVTVDFAFGPGGDVDVQVIALEAPHRVQAVVRLGKNKSVRRKRPVPADSCVAACVTRAWWFEKDGDARFGVADSVATVVAALDAHGPVHGFLGFSQGGSLASLLLSPPDVAAFLPEADAAAGPEAATAAARLGDVRLGVFFSAYAFLPTLRPAPGTKTLHSFSQLDRMIFASKSEELRDAMQPGAETQQHDGGHNVPTPACHDMLRAFLHTDSASDSKREI